MTDMRKRGQLPATAGKNDLVVLACDPRRTPPAKLAAEVRDLQRRYPDTPQVAIRLCMCDGDDCTGCPPIYEQPWARVWAREWLDAHADLMPLLVDERKLNIVQRMALPGFGRLALVLIAGHGDAASWAPDDYGRALLGAFDGGNTEGAS
jgi:hypothetical protein